MRNTLLVLPLLLIASVTAAQDANDPLAEARAVASDGGRAEASQQEAVSEDADPVNRQALAQTADGIVVTLTIDGVSVSLDSAIPARVPLSTAKATRKAGGDTVQVVAFANGRELGRTEVPDQVLNASEGEGLVRTTRRQLIVPIIVARAVDTIEVSAPATNARARLDVSSAWARYCDREGRSPWCIRQP